MSRLSKSLKLLLILCAAWLGTTSVSGQSCEIQIINGTTNHGCAPLRVDFRVTNPSGKTISSVQWNFGDGGKNTNPKSDSTLSYIYLKYSKDTTKDYVPTVTVTYSDGTTCSATYNGIIKVWDNPVAKINLPSNAVQCLKDNKYCYTQASKKSRNGFDIVRYAWDFGDGTVDTGDVTSGSPAPNPNIGVDKNGCYGYQTTGSYNVKLVVTDARGCSSKDEIDGKIKILPNLIVSINVASKQVCGSTMGTFTNGIPDTTGWHVKNFSWDFGDGSAPNTTDWGKTKPVKHNYTDTGTFYPTFCVLTKEGCKACTPVGSYKIIVISAHLKMHFKDTICWSDANSKGVLYTPDPMDNVDTSIWNFAPDDNGKAQSDWKFSPAAMFIGYVGPVTYHYAKGPKDYQGTLTVIHHICGKIDTCWVTHIKGPQATINITPPGFETFLPPVPLNYTYGTNKGILDTAFSRHVLSMKPFLDMIDTVHKVTCNRSIAWQYYSKTSPTTSIDSGYCDATIVSKTNDTAKFCTGDTIISIGSITRRSNNFKKIITDSAIAASDVFVLDSFILDQLDGGTGKHKNSTFPFQFTQYKKFVYSDFIKRMNDPASNPVSASNSLPDINKKQNMLWTQPSGSLFENNMHDSDKYTCEPERLVRFTNNSTKFRLVNQIDDHSMSVDPDTCAHVDPYLKHKRDSLGDANPGSVDSLPYAGRNNYPFSSDSLAYYWDFGDGLDHVDPNSKLIGLPDTAYFSHRNQFDLLKYSREAAPWHYYDPKKAPKNRPCYSVTLKVFDFKTGCKDQASIQLLFGRPKADWDKDRYCRMNYYIQAHLPGGLPQDYSGTKPQEFRGFKLVPLTSTDGSGPCAANGSTPVRYKIDIKETKPAVCESPKGYWVCFDSAAAKQYSINELVGDTFYKHFKRGDLVGTKVSVPGPGLSAAKNTDAITCLYNGRFDGGNYVFDTIWNYHWTNKLQIEMFGDAPGYAKGGFADGKGNWAYSPNDTGCKTIGLVVQNGDCFDTAWYHNYICFNKVNANIDLYADVTGSEVPMRILTSLWARDTTQSGQHYPPYLNFGWEKYPKIDSSFEGHTYDSLLYPVLSYDVGSDKWVGNTRTVEPIAKSGYPATSIARIRVRDKNQALITKFESTIHRLQIPGPNPYWDYDSKLSDIDYYYDDNNHIWPDRVSLNTDYTDVDSINKIRTTLYFPKVVAYTPPNEPALYTITIDSSFTPPHIDTVVLSVTGNQIYITQEEMNALDSGKSPIISRKDDRYSYLNTSCNAHAQVSIHANAKNLPVAVGSSISILDLNDTTSTHLDNKGYPHSVMRFLLPWPGLYKITTNIVDIRGCNSQQDFYVINAHYAKFGSTDSVQCANRPVHFTNVVRYWTTDFNLRPWYRDPNDGNRYWMPDGWTWSHVPQDATIIGRFFDADSLAEFSPWDGDPIGVRKSMWSDWPMKWLATDTNHQEKVWWDFDNDGHIDASGPNPTWTYSKPGVYTVRMITRDSLGRQLQTFRRNFIKIIDVKANFYAIDTSGRPAGNPDKEDTLEFCAPHLYHIFDSTNISMGVGTYHYTPERKYIFAYQDSVIKIDPKTKKKIIVPAIIKCDSVISWIWNMGDEPDGTPRKVIDVHKTRYTQPYDHIYTHNDTFTLSLKVQTQLTCGDSITKVDYIKQIGPQPRFKFTFPYSGYTERGCLPFTIKVRNLNIKDSSKYLWNQHDGRTVVTDRTSSIVDLTYTHLKHDDSISGVDSSVYTLTVTEEGQVLNFLTGQTLKCSATWPNENDTLDPVFRIVVYRRDTLIIKGDTIVCPKQLITFHDSSTDEKIFSHIGWQIADLSGNDIQGDSGSGSTFTTQFDNPGIYMVKIRGTLKYHYNPSTQTYDKCDDVVSYRRILVERVHANFTIDSATLGALGKFTFLNHSFGGARYLWNYNYISSTPKMQPDETINDTSSRYWDYEKTIGIKNTPDSMDFSFQVRLIAISPIGCSDTMIDTVHFRRNFQTYNVITPDGNGKNDVFNPRVIGDKYYHIMIFNRWGEKVFESTDKNQDWNGKNSNTGGECPAGTYYYIVKYDLIGKDKGIGSKTGTITVIR